MMMLVWELFIAKIHGILIHWNAKLVFFDLNENTDIHKGLRREGK
jgi:hypothetical protein